MQRPFFLCSVASHRGLLHVFKLQLQPVGNEGDKLRIGGLSLGIGDRIAEKPLQCLQIAPIPGHLDGMADGALHPGGRGGKGLGHLGMSTLVMALMTSMSPTAILMASRRYW